MCQNASMELFLLILRNTAIALVGTYLVFVLLDVIFVISFSSILSQHDHDLSLILTNKKDNIDKLAALLNKHGVKLDKKKLEELSNFDLKKIEHQDGEEAKNARELLTSLSEYFLYVARDNEKVSSDPEFFEIANNIDEQEKIYRQHLVLYNADVLGYNFWISFFLTRYIYKILKRKTKDIIS